MQSGEDPDWKGTGGEVSAGLLVIVRGRGISHHLGAVFPDSGSPACLMVQWHLQSAVGERHPLSAATPGCLAYTSFPWRHFLCPESILHIHRRGVQGKLYIFGSFDSIVYALKNERIHLRSCNLEIMIYDKKRYMYYTT